jgi:hypothetical protein
MSSMTVTTAAEVIPTIVAAETLGALMSNAVLINLVNRDYDNEVASFGNTVKVGVRGSLSVGNKAAATDLTPQAPTESYKSVILDKHKAIAIQADDIALMLSRPDLISGYAYDAAIAIVEQVEADIAALYSGLSQTINATGGLSEANFREARRQLNAAKAPLANRYAILHEDAEYELLGIEKATNRDYAESLGAATGAAFTGRFMGFDIFMDQNIAVATGVAKNLFFQRNALTLVSRPMRQTASPNVNQAVMAENGISVRVTMTYNALGLAEVMIIDTLYGVAELRDNHGVVVSTTEI